MTENLSNRGHFDKKPFTPVQYERINGLGEQDISVNPDGVRRVIQSAERGGVIDPQLFFGGKSVSSFTEDRGFLPPSSALLVTAKGWDTSIGQRLTARLVGGASRGSTSYAQGGPIDAVLGFVTLVPADTEEVTRDLIQANRVVTSDIVQPRAASVDADKLYIAGENNVHVIDSLGNSSRMHHEELGTAHDLSFSDNRIAIAASDSDQIVMLNKSSGDVAQVVNLIDHGYHLSIGHLPDRAQNGLYIFPDQIPVADALKPKGINPDQAMPLLAHRDGVEKVPTSQQTTHINAVEFLDPHRLVATVFNSSSVDADGNISDEPGGEIILVTTAQQHGLQGESIKDLLTSDAIEWDVVENETGYPLPEGNGYCNKTYYFRGPERSIVVKEITGGDGAQTTTIERVVTLDSGLRNPHSISHVADIDTDNVLLGMSNTSAGEIRYYQLNKATEELRQVGSLDFRDLPGSPREGINWIHHIVRPTVLPNGEVVTTVYDGMRKGIHILNMTTQKRMFIPVTEDATIYQTQLIV